ncbi:response regulator [Polaribacter dokdonensis]|uniref:Two component transcriptional regulator, LytTR family n=1 Tax=Polaribacter dokdonensis DSW-5 TaxID=1300348 RepID=A0A0N0CG04_9FLAO|nr:response regulator [Polaribacter dokdonensis]KOY52570.1 Two-component system response regulator, LytR/AlgR family [Polaribacter dokdonensis DSW-5]SEE48144.1 two component transcriptional regulator, LytTR family [Polaribacter dokdonensis DSW-5]
MRGHINILIVEDNVIIADDLQYTIESLGHVVVGNVISYNDACIALQNKKVDLVFIDIQIASKETGIDLAEFINENHIIPFVFLTSNSDTDTIELASKTKPSGYLVKPFHQNNLKAAIEIAISNHKSKQLEEAQDIIFVKKNNFQHKIILNNVLFIKSDNIYLELHCEDGSMFLQRATLKSFLPQLPNYFKRCHKSYIVNIKYITAFNKKALMLNDESIPVSNQYIEILDAITS